MQFSLLQQGSSCERLSTRGQKSLDILFYKAAIVHKFSAYFEYNLFRLVLKNVICYLFLGTSPTIVFATTQQQQQQQYWTTAVFVFFVVSGFRVSLRKLIMSTWVVNNVIHNNKNCAVVIYDFYVIYIVLTYADWVIQTVRSFILWWILMLAGITKSAFTTGS